MQIIYKCQFDALTLFLNELLVEGELLPVWVSMKKYTDNSGLAKGKHLN